ncbi:interleukin-15 receptor subunit alpha isoform 7 precursor [Danio rerio]|uniref:Interleukin 15 receptor alpha isoform 6 n=1 Tax=Danio rerio TaxID=7955 RepID=B1N741_DANRE|nr:interleukin-15 receptor subunit alpha isoform 7 precursor [Danio rerio]ABO15453.1 interleukin 15 receptor alpha isoform 6 [Danio rerio]|eukprot:XP_005164857.1 zgc:195175 isoform X6 [Danio rerio]
MYMLVILIFVTSAYQHNIARASDLCGPPKKALNTEPVTGNYSLNSSIRIQCVAGYVRKVGTSNLIRCLKEHDKDKPSWTSALPLVCIQAPRPDHQFTSSTTEINTPTISGTSTSITVEPSFARSKSTIGGVTSIFILCLAATLFILWWRSRRRDYTNVIVLQLTNQDAVYSDIPVSVIAPNPNNASIDSTAVIGTNHPQADSVQDSDSIHL